jgi:hypothetical protein
MLNYAHFQIGFWHPFGPHGHEEAKEILERKRREIDENKWTLWSFQKRHVLDAWLCEIHKVNPDAVHVFCSMSTGAVTPEHDPVDCTSFLWMGEPASAWRQMPEKIRVPHPFRDGSNEASAFVVERVEAAPDPFELPKIEWLCFKGGPHWRRDRVPTRGEYLIKAGGGERMRRCRAVLILKDPYLALVRTEGG